MPATAKFLPCGGKAAARRGGAAWARHRSRRFGVGHDRRRQNAQGKFTSPPASNHPQFAMHALLDPLRLATRRCRDTGGAPAPHGRDVLVSEVMRPSTATAQWHNRLAQPDIAAKISIGMKDLAVVAAAQSGNGSARDSGRTCARRGHLGKSAALVTPDRALARRVMAALDPLARIEFDDSGGDALMETTGWRVCPV